MVLLSFLWSGIDIDIKKSSNNSRLDDNGDIDDRCLFMIFSIIILY